MKRKLKFISLFVLFLMVVAGCGDAKKEKVVLYSSGYDYENEYYVERLKEEFPDYDIVLQYQTTGNHGAKLKAEGTNSEADISIGLDTVYLDMINESLVDLSDYDVSEFEPELLDENHKYIPAIRNGTSIILNLDIFEEKGLEEPNSYEDLLKPEYEGLISMPSPKSSGTGYAFLKSLVNEWGEEEAFAYFDQLENNILQFTSSGSGPVNSLIQGETAIALGMTSQAVRSINEGMNLKILIFEEGSPYSVHGHGIIKGNEDNQAVQEVFDFFYTDLIEESNEKFYPEKIYQDKEPTTDNYPQNIQYSDMSGNTAEERERLLEKWAH